MIEAKFNKSLHALVYFYSIPLNTIKMLLHAQYTTFLMYHISNAYYKAILILFRSPFPFQPLI